MGRVEIVRGEERGREGGNSSFAPGRKKVGAYGHVYDSFLIIVSVSI
jgi:hypothetical protein